MLLPDGRGRDHPEPLSLHETRRSRRGVGDAAAAAATISRALTPRTPPRLPLLLLAGKHMNVVRDEAEQGGRARASRVRESAGVPAGVAKKRRAPKGDDVWGEAGTRHWILSVGSLGVTCMVSGSPPADDARQPDETRRHDTRMAKYFLAVFLGAPTST